MLNGLEKPFMVIIDNHIPLVHTNETSIERCPMTVQEIRKKLKPEHHIVLYDKQGRKCIACIKQFRDEEESMQVRYVGLSLENEKEEWIKLSSDRVTDWEPGHLDVQYKHVHEAYELKIKMNELQHQLRLNRLIYDFEIAKAKLIDTKNKVHLELNDMRKRDRCFFINMIRELVHSEMDHVLKNRFVKIKTTYIPGIKDILGELQEEEPFRSLFVLSFDEVRVQSSGIEASGDSSRTSEWHHVILVRSELKN